MAEQYPWGAIKDPLVIAPGALRHQVELQANCDGQDPVTKKPATEWTPLLTTLAAINTLAVKEVYQTGQYTGQVTHRVTLRWPGSDIAIAAGCRVVFGARVFVVQGIENVQERNRILHLLCQEIDGVQ